MFTNTAYEAVYEYLGLQLHSKFIEIITAQKVFSGLILLTFGFLFLNTTLHFFSSYITGVLVKRRLVPLSKFIQIIVCLFLGMSVLKVGSSSVVKKFNGESWDANPYVHAQIPAVEPQYKVSFVFDLLSGTAEEFSAFLTRIIDSLFKSTNSQTDAPNFFFKAIMYAGSSTIDDPDLKNQIKFYTEECFDKVLPLIKEGSRDKKLNRFFGTDGSVDKALADIVLEQKENSVPYTCLDVKNEVHDKLKFYSQSKADGVFEKFSVDSKQLTFGTNAWANFQVSSLLVNHYLDSHEDLMGIQKPSELPTNSGKIFQYINRLFSFDGLLSLFGGRSLHGASLAASRAQEFSDNLSRAPHVAGFIKMVAIFIFPWLVFAIVAGYWKVLVYWFLVYFSVLLWTPIWTLLYHIIVGISLSSEVMEAFGSVSDGISLYGAELITSRMYQMFAVYSWLQLLIGTLFTGGLLYFVRPMLTDTQKDSAPDFLDDAGKTVHTGSKIAGAL